MVKLLEGIKREPLQTTDLKRQLSDKNDFTFTAFNCEMLTAILIGQPEFFKKMKIKVSFRNTSLIHKTLLFSWFLLCQV